MGTVRDADWKGDTGTRVRRAGAETEVAGGPPRRKKARLDRIGQTLWVSVACLKL